MSYGGLRGVYRRHRSIIIYGASGSAGGCLFFVLFLFLVADTFACCHEVARSCRNCRDAAGFEPSSASHSRAIKSLYIYIHTLATSLLGCVMSPLLSFYMIPRRRRSAECVCAAARC